MDDPARRAYQILHAGFVAIPTIAGIDKFFHLITNWDKYLAPQIARLLPFRGHTFMLIAGVIEIIAGLIVAVKPRVGGFLVSAWLCAIALDLVLLGGNLDVAIRDLGLAAGAFSLAELAAVYEPGRERAPARRAVTTT